MDKRASRALAAVSPLSGPTAEPQVQPIFLLSLPRSGSTLVQRVLATYDEVATEAEPWILLPGLLPLRGPGSVGSAWHRTMGAAVSEFLESLPSGREAYLEALRTLALTLYGQAAQPGARWFLDKSPPYHLVLDDLVAMFPEGRFIFLWRNPLSVLSSMVETFAGGRWRPERFRGDLFNGVSGLVEGYQRHCQRAIAVRYEDLVNGGEQGWRRIAEYVGLGFDVESLTRFDEVALSGRMGDPTGRARYHELASEPVEKWKGTISTPVRKAWAARYLRWIGAERMAVMGYDLRELQDELAAAPTSRAGLSRDVLDVGDGVLREIVRGSRGSDGFEQAWRCLLFPD